MKSLATYGRIVTCIRAILLCEQVRQERLKRWTLVVEGEQLPK